MRAQVRFELKVPIKVFKGESAYIAHCPVFDIASQDKTQNEARKNVSEALVSFIITCFEMGTLNKVLKTIGFNPRLSIQKKVCVDKSLELIDVPIPALMLQDSRRRECRA
jgi:hypothetical protein